MNQNNCPFFNIGDGNKSTNMLGEKIVGTNLPYSPMKCYQGAKQRLPCGVITVVGAAKKFKSGTEQFLKLGPQKLQYFET